MDVAVSVAVSVEPLAAPPGTSTLRQTFMDAPLVIAIDGSAEVHEASRTVAGNVPDVAAERVRVVVEAEVRDVDRVGRRGADVGAIGLAGRRDPTAYGGAIGVAWALPLAPTPWVDVTTMPSLTIAVTLDGSDGEIVTVKCRSRWPCAAMVSPVQWTAPLEKVPPSPALVKVVLAGIGSVTETPVAVALPMFETVTV